MEKKRKEIRLRRQKKEVPMWLLRLGQVKAELRTVRFAGTSEEGLRQCAALSDIALRLFRDQMRNARTNLDDRQITLETQRLLTRLIQAESTRELIWRKDRVRYFGR